MALDTRRPTVPAPTPRVSARPTNVSEYAHHAHNHEHEHRPTRVALVLLAAFMALTTISGAIFVVPTIPRAWLHQGLIAPFADYTIPALALGILCGGAAVAAFVTVLVRPRLGALVSIAAGVLMIGFELVEILVVGFTPIIDPTQPQAWLQPFFIAVGAALALLGARLWKAENSILNSGRPQIPAL